MTDTLALDQALVRQALRDFGFFGHYLHMNAGGRSGQQHILVKLRKRGDHMTQRDLQELSGISSASMSEVLAKLEASGLIERTRSDEDRRQLDIALTDEGRTRADELIEKHKAFESSCMACLTEDELRQLIEVLDRVVEHWKTLEGEGACA